MYINKNESNLFFRFIFEKLSKIKKQPLFFWFFGLVFLIGISRAVGFRWVCDDAFISFRYAKNLVEGQGLVFNEGEFVEGYTNFLWTIGIALGMILKIDPLRWVQFWGLIFFALSILILYFLSYKLQQEISEDNKYFFPVAAFAFALQTHAQIYATGGLETSFFGFLILLGYTLILWKEELAYIFWGNLVLVLSALTRPEGILFSFFGVLFVILFRLKNQTNNVIKARLFFATFPWICIYFPYLIWKLEYYGKFFPNTFSAKYNHGSALEQGVNYTILYFNSYFVFYLSAFLLGIFFFKILKIIQKLNKEKRILRRRLASISYKDQFEIHTQPIEAMSYPKIVEVLFLFFLPSLIYVIYLTYIGGDFMFARLLISISPLLFFSQEALWLFTTKGKLRLLLGILIIIMTILYYNPYRGLRIPIIKNISSENDIYKLKDIYQIKQILLPVQKFVRESGLRMAFGGAQAVMIYYLNPKYALETEAGLTDAYIASLPTNIDGKIGHGKKVPKSYLRKKRIHIHLNPVAITKTEYNGIQIKNLPYTFRIFIYEKKVFDILEASGKFEFIPFEEYLDDYISKIKFKKIERIRKDYFKFRKYYFKWNSDFEREKFFLRDNI